MRPQLMELAEERNQPFSRRTSRNASSEKRAFTPPWASSKLPRTAQTPTLSPDWVTICSLCISLTPCSG